MKKKVVLNLSGKAHNIVMNLYREREGMKVFHSLSFFM